MREVEINAIFSIVRDPEVNKVDLSDKKTRNEIERIIRIMDITKAQKDDREMKRFIHSCSKDLVYSCN